MKTEVVRMVALRPMYYEKDLQADEEFDARPDHARVLAMVGSAKILAPEPAEPPKKYSRRDLRAKE